MVEALPGREARLVPALLGLEVRLVEASRHHVGIREELE